MTTTYYVQATNQTMTYRQLQAEVKSHRTATDTVALTSKATVLVDWLNDRLETMEDDTSSMSNPDQEPAKTEAEENQAWWDNAEPWIAEATDSFYVPANNTFYSYRQLQTAVSYYRPTRQSISLSADGNELALWLNDYFTGTATMEDDTSSMSNPNQETEVNTSKETVTMAEDTVNAASGASVNTAIAPSDVETENRVGFDANYDTLSAAFPFLTVTVSNWQRLLSIYNSPESYRSVCKAVQQPAYQPGRQGNQSSYVKDTAYHLKNKEWNAARLEEQRRGLSIRTPLTSR